MLKNELINLYKNDKKTFEEKIKKLYYQNNLVKINNITLKDFLLIVKLPSTFILEDDTYCNMFDHYSYHGNNIFYTLYSNQSIPFILESPIPFNFVNYDQKYISNVYYYEITLDKERFREELNNEMVSFGYSIKTVIDNFHIGWNNYSIGYHSDDGNIFMNSYQYNSLEKYNIGDTVGAGIIYKDVNKYEIFFTKNGELIVEGITFNNSQHIYPSLSFKHSVGISVNFGKYNFKYDFSQHIDPHILSTYNSYKINS